MTSSDATTDSHSDYFLVEMRGVNELTHFKEMEREVWSPTCDILMTLTYVADCDLNLQVLIIA